MKYFWTILILLAISVPVMAEDFEVTEAQYVVITGNVSDTLGRTRITPDSMRIVVTDSAGTELFDAWFESADDQCKLNGNVIVFIDQWEDINGAASIGIFNIMVTIASDGSGNIDLFSNQNYTLKGLTTPTETAFNKSAYFDTLIYLGAVWVDAAASNTNTVVGTDGTPKNPVSTLVAAKTVADALGYQQYNIINSSSLTLAATHENWEFIGIGEGSLINLGGQDVDGSVFEHLMISGTQGGTGVMGLHNCYLNTIDSLEAIVISSSLSDTISVRVSTNTVFDQCYSNIAGNNTPGLDFDSTGVIKVSLRHYSGGLTIFNGTPNQTMSFEAFGQLIIDATCTSVNVTARGCMDITNNGTTTALTQNAVFNQTITQATLDVVNSITLAGTNISTIAEANSLTDGIETNTYVATQIHDETYYQVAESDGVVGTNLNINTFIQFDIGADTKPVSVTYIARLDEGSAPSGNDTLHIWVYDWDGSSWTHINPPGEDIIGIFNSDPSDDVTFEIQLIDPNYVSDDSGKVRIAYSNYDPDGATADNLEEDTEFYLDFAFIEYQSALTAPIIADEVNDSIFFADTSTYNGTADSYGLILADPGYIGNVTSMDNDVITNASIVDDLTFDSLHTRTFVIKNNSGTGTGLHIESNAAHGMWVKTAGTGTTALYADGSGGTNSNGLKAEGTGTGQDFYGGLSDGSIDSLTHPDAYWNALQKIAGDSSAGTTAEEVKNAVWGQAADTAFAAGSMGDSAKYWGRAGASGSGNRLCSLFVWDGTSALTNGKTRMTSGATTHTADISGAGFAVYNLDDATWVGLVTASGYSQDTIPQTFIITAAVKDTFNMTANTPGAAVLPGAVNCYVYTYDMGVDTLQGATLTARPSGHGPWTDSLGVIVLVSEKTAVSDDSGYVKIELYPTHYVTNADGDSLKYDFEFNHPTTFRARFPERVVPDSVNWEIN